MRYRKSCIAGAGVSGSICEGAGNAATTIDSGLSEAAVVSVVPVTGSAAVATSAPAALPIGFACGSSASLALAVRDAAVGAAPVLLMPAEPRPASQPTMHPARTTVPQNAGATAASRRG